MSEENISDSEDFEKFLEIYQNVYSILHPVSAGMRNPDFKPSNWKEKVAFKLLKTTAGKASSGFEEAEDQKAHAFGMIQGVFNSLVPSIPFVRELETALPETDEAIELPPFLQSCLDYCPKSEIEVDEFEKGFIATSAGILTPTGDFKHKTPRTHIYTIMLFLSKELESCDTVDDMFDTYISRVFPAYDMDAWKRLCTEVGLRGTKYAKYK